MADETRSNLDRNMQQRTEYAPSPVRARGIPAAPGSHVGTVRIIRSERDCDGLAPGDVLVYCASSPAAPELCSRIGALVMEAGGVLSRPATAAREHGIPALVATRNATALLHGGERVKVDGKAGVVELLP